MNFFYTVNELNIQKGIISVLVRENKRSLLELH